MPSNLESQRRSFEHDPSDEGSFRALEEDAYLRGDWDDLTRVYQRRLEAPLAPADRADAAFRMGQIDHDQRADLDAAAQTYRQVLLAAPDHRLCLLRLYQLYADREDWRSAVEIAQREAALPLPGAERTRVWIAIGKIWFRELEEPHRALDWFRRASSTAAGSGEALEEMARCHEALGDPEGAATAWQERVELLDGPERAAARISLARLFRGPLARPLQATRLIEQAMQDDPALAHATQVPGEDTAAQAGGGFEGPASTAPANFSSEVHGPSRSAEMALELGLHHLETREEPAPALRWLLRARELAPDDPLVSRALCDAARQLGDEVALIEAMEHSIAIFPGDPPASRRMEIASLHSARGDEEQALVQLQRALESTPDDALVAEALSDTLMNLGRYESLVTLLEGLVAASEDDPETRATRLREIAKLQRDHLDEPEQGAEALEQAFLTDPSLPGLATELLELHHQSDDPAPTGLGRARRYAQHLVEIEPGHRAATEFLAEDFERRDRPEDALSVLETRLRILKQDGSADSESATRESASSECIALSLRIAALREGGLGDHEGAIAVLEELAESPRLPAAVAERLADLYLEGDYGEELIEVCHRAARTSAFPPERASWNRRLGDALRDRLQEREAIDAYRRVLEDRPDDRNTRDELLRLYRRDKAHEPLAQLLEEMLAGANGEDEIGIRLELAELYAGPLSRTQDGLHQLRRLLEIAPDPSETAERTVNLLEEIGYGALDATTLEQLHSHYTTAGRHVQRSEVIAVLIKCPELSERRRSALHREVAQLFDTQLDDPDRSAHHWYAVLCRTEPGQEQYVATLRSLAQALRAAGNHDGWARCAEAELDALGPAEAALDDPRIQLRLELARTHEDRLKQPDAAAAHLHSVVAALSPQTHQSAATQPAGSSPCPTTSNEADEQLLALLRESESSLLGRLGDVYWHELRMSAQARRAYESALEVNPGDLDARRSFELLLEAVEDWQGALALYEAEIEILGESSPERRRQISLRCAVIASDHCDEPERAVAALCQAAAIEPLKCRERRALAELHLNCGEPEAFVRVFSSWCDDEESGATTLDHLELARVLDQQGRSDEAPRRVERALALDETCLAAWDILVDLEKKRGDLPAAAHALERAAVVSSDVDAARRLLRASALMEETDCARAAELLRSAVARDPANPDAHAELAHCVERLDDPTEAESLARIALELYSVGADSSDREIRSARTLRAALVGGRCATRRGSPEQAADFYFLALATQPDDTEALAGYGESLASLGNYADARIPLQKLVEIQPDPERRSLHLTLIGRGLEAIGEPDSALGRFEDALTADPDFGPAHECVIAAHRTADRVDAGIAGLERWAKQAREPEQRVERLLCAAQWELEIGGREESAEHHLRGALDSGSDNGRVAALLASVLWSQRRANDALEVAALGLEASDLENPESDASRAALATIRAQALEAENRPAEATESFALAAQWDARNIEAALNAARLLGTEGDWRKATDLLEQFTEPHPGDDPSGLARALEEWARLLSGPLEDIAGAVTLYRRAIALDPARRDARASLAHLLAHRPGDWEEARGHLEALLDEDPTHPEFLRRLLRTAERRKRPEAIKHCRHILEALGMAPPGTPRQSSNGARFAWAGDGQLSQPLWEKLRVVSVEASRAIALALPASHGGGGSDESTATAGDGGFQSALLAKLAQITAPDLLLLPDERLAEMLALTAEAAFDHESSRGAGRIVKDLSDALGRRARRRIRTALRGEALKTLQHVEFAKWRHDCRALAAALAIDEGAGSLREGLIALACETRDHETRDREASEFSGGDDIRAVVAASPSATALLKRAVRSCLWSL